MSKRQNLHIALLEDDRDQAEQTSGWIKSIGDHCDIYTTAAEFQRKFQKSTYDMVLLDWILLNGGTGLEILYWLRKTLGSDVPTIFLTARQSEDDIVTALRAGADDYLIKPIRQHELLARLYALARRSSEVETEVLTFPPFEFNTTNRELRLNNKLILLTQKEYELTLFLFHNRGKVLSRGNLLSSVWGTSAELNTRTVDTHISRLRKKLDLRASDRWSISSVYQHGYRLEEQLETPTTDRIVTDNSSPLIRFEESSITN